MFKNEYEETRLALCLVDHDDTRLPIVDLGRPVLVSLLSTALTTPHVGRTKHSPSKDSYVCKPTPWQNRQVRLYVLFNRGLLNLISSLFPVGKPMESNICAVPLVPRPIAVTDLPEVRVIDALLSIPRSCHMKTAFIFYTQQNGLARLEEPF